ALLDASGDVISSRVGWTRSFLRAVPASAALLLVPGACTPEKRGSGSERRDIRRPSAEAAAPTPRPTPVSISFACGRATARLPGDSQVTAAQSRPCVDPGYGADLEATSVAGAQSFHALRHGPCEIKLTASERMTLPGAQGEHPASSARATADRAE